MGGYRVASFIPIKRRPEEAIIIAEAMNGESTSISCQIAPANIPKPKVKV